MKQFKEFRSKKDGQYYFNLYDKDDNFLFEGEGYKSKRGKNIGITAVRKCSQFINNYIRKTAKDGRLYFILKAHNGEPLGTSKMCDTEEERDECITSIMKNLE